MRMSLTIDEELLNGAMDLFGTRVKREAVELAIREAIRARRRARLLEHAGTPVIVVDSSAWIEYYRPSGDARVRELVRQAVASDQAAVNATITVETVGFARPESQEAVAADLRGVHSRPITDAVTESAIGICAGLRARGITVPVTDAMIAATALVNGASLIHVDENFTTMGKHFPLHTGPA